MVIYSAISKGRRILAKRRAVQFKHIDFLDAEIRGLDKTIPGEGRHSAEFILVEIGTEIAGLMGRCVSG